MTSPKPYTRDKRSPEPANETVSKYMRSNRSTNTKPEIRLRKAMWQAGMRGYRLHWKKAPGKPDIAFPGKKLAIFMNGCFWHRCPYCKLRMPKNNADFWKTKFARNVERDQEKLNALHADGWQTLVIWECQIKKNIDAQIYRIMSSLLLAFNSRTHRTGNLTPNP